jgi:hypothetical protein
VRENSALSPLGERVARAGACTSRRGTGLRPPKGKRRAVNNIGFGPQAGEGGPDLSHHTRFSHRLFSPTLPTTP